MLNDNSVRALQWQRLVGEFFAPIFGGSAETWAEANRVVANGLFEHEAWQARLRAAADYESFDRAYFLDWMGRMCQLMGVPMPPEEEALRLSREASAWITSHVRADYPGAVDAIRLLKSRGYVLHMASGASSTDLEGYLGAMGVRDCFGRLYGGDLINTLKAGLEFYERIFADVDVAPADALVLDDNPRVLAWPAEVGARTLLVGEPASLSLPGFLGTIGGLAELPAFLASRGEA